MIINSLLENDAYKFSMGQCIYHQFPSYTTTWSFKCRNKDVIFTNDMLEDINNEIKHYCSLKFKPEELAYLRTIKWLKEDYIAFLKLWHPCIEDFNISLTDGKLNIEIMGTWLNTSMYEIPLLAIVNEVYFRHQYNKKELEKSFKEKLYNKINKLNKEYFIGNFSEFGLRRRLSSETQDFLIQQLVQNKVEGFVGTSNVFLARKYGVKPVGTMAHEFIMCVGQGNHKHNPAYSNWYMMDAWIKEYGILNGIALTDTITTDVFLRDFKLTYATLFSGVRHDSSDPIEWGYKILKHYEHLGIDPKTKTLLFSDSLDFEKATKIYNEFKDKTNVAFGIGTYLSNDTFAEPLNIVTKVTKCNGFDVAKLSDCEGKNMCKNPKYIEYLRRTIDWRMNNEIID